VPCEWTVSVTVIPGIASVFRAKEDQERPVHPGGDLLGGDRLGGDLLGGDRLEGDRLGGVRLGDLLLVDLLV